VVDLFLYFYLFASVDLASPSSLRSVAIRAKRFGYFGTDYKSAPALGSIMGDVKINHPGRDKLLQFFEYHCAAATPP
jgi:hypothetical protein